MSPESGFFPHRVSGKCALICCNMSCFFGWISELSLSFLRLTKLPGLRCVLSTFIYSAIKSCYVVNFLQAVVFERRSLMYYFLQDL
ncbi:hypothetical protein Nepgr_005714 [Nepenthes gracilis]|uniref:Uncharacterized protein n=1 Tax=Nepenthes gracilis TaxID=150966 RepID=A0AAD3S409_NEPGR|nr:hypothetical protein Nepgr_005714 [Nepenthes gracilis]